MNLQDSVICPHWEGSTSQVHSQGQTATLNCNAYKAKNFISFFCFGKSGGVLQYIVIYNLDIFRTEEIYTYYTKRFYLWSDFSISLQSTTAFSLPPPVAIKKAQVPRRQLTNDGWVFFRIYVILACDDTDQYGQKAGQTEQATHHDGWRSATRKLCRRWVERWKH